MRLGAIHRPTPPKRIRAGLSVVRNYPAREAVDYLEGLTFDGRNALGNDVLLNCVPCAFLRLAQARWKRISGDDIDPQTPWAMELYSAWTGFVPGEPDTDKGADVLDAMEHWTAKGIEVRPGLLDIGAWLAVPILNLSRVRAAVDVAIGCLMTLQLFEGDVETDIWDGVPPSAEPIGSHEVVCLGYDPTCFVLISWGRVVRLTNWGAAERLEAIQAPLSRIITDDKGLSATGQTWAEVLAAMDQIDVV